MGASWTQVGSLNAAQSARIGLLPPTRVVVDQVAGPFRPTSTSSRTAGAAPGARALEIVDPLTSSAYVLEYRTATGRDGYLAVPPPTSPTSPPACSCAGWSPPATPTRPSCSTARRPRGRRGTGTPTRVPAGRHGPHPGCPRRHLPVSADATKATVHLTQETPIDLAHAAAGGDGGCRGRPPRARPAATTAAAARPSSNFALRTRSRRARGLRRDRRDLGRAGAEHGVLGYPAGDGLRPARRRGGSLPVRRSVLVGGRGAHAVSGGIRAAGGSSGWRTGCWDTRPPTWCAGCAAGAAARRSRPARCTGRRRPGRTRSRAGSGRPGRRSAWDGARATRPRTALRAARRRLRPGLPRRGGVLSPFGRARGLGRHPGDLDLDGAENGVLGYPVRLVCGLRDGGCGRPSRRARCTGRPARGCDTVSGAIRATWGSLRFENGALGYPVSEMVCYPTGCHQFFQRGTLTWSAATNTVARG